MEPTLEEMKAALEDAVQTLESVDEWLRRADVENEPYFDMAVGEINSWRKSYAQQFQSEVSA